MERMKMNVDKFSDGFYIMRKPDNSEPCLVKLYTPIVPPVRGFGFGVWDGGAFVFASDINDDTVLIPVISDTLEGC